MQKVDRPIPPRIIECHWRVAISERYLGPQGAGQSNLVEVGDMIGSTHLEITA